MEGRVSYEVDGDVAVVTIIHPPLNVFSFHVRCALVKALGRASSDEAVRAVVLLGDGRVFSAGADIAEFDEPLRVPTLSEINEWCETLGKPVVAAIQGAAIGGGLEVALACHARVALAGAQLSLPEVQLGLLPGAGGTQRLPRLIHPAQALDMIVSGKPVEARAAAAMGLVDHVVEGDLLAGAKAYVRALGAAPPSLVRDREDKLDLARAERAELEDQAIALAKKAGGLEAPLACIEAVCLALDMPFDEGLRRERALFEKLLPGRESRAQRHLFFAERRAAKVEGISPDVPVRDVNSIAVIGAGTMGGGIAMAFVNAGIPVTVLDRDQVALDRGLAAVRKIYDGSVQRGSISAETRDARLGRLRWSLSYEDVAEADLIIEAVFEEMEAKKAIFRQLDAHAKPGTVLASNTSFLDINEIARVTSRPADVLGLHFFSPASVMRLLEIVRGRDTSPEVLATALAVARRINKTPVVVGVCYGFVGNRMLAARSVENESLLLEGADPEVVDAAFAAFGFPMGPFAMIDLSGLDISWLDRKSRGETAAVADALCEAGRLGQKTGAGFFRYDNGARKGVPDPEVATLIRAKAAEFGVKRRQISADEIIERTLYPMINEAARIVEEGIAARPSDIDVVWTAGFGFPVAKGGPMFWADCEGLARIVDRLDHWHARLGKSAFEPAPLLRRLAEESRTFNYQNAEAG